ncbi:Aminodeoxychorismate lyase [Pseudoalteromonas sp. P1-16-1b]|uniref:aminodeoxychorismate lyase n=1 Tax=unclassified Pseudoalteromonas TaxID=194690 RepID=UPI0006D67E54|nr:MULTISPECIES: aminodeoxychorismate lyase [unclassified Pseudoalteromonas]KPZ66050.1 Aminodeoxychorismate lyase [Pseudoalteromonas sp. P1-16-1b]MCK8125800.1 aminodeoxychorismate lyase [Pseudoalteromonas sp. 2CM39R]TMP63669.1 aminodeoxychorismate lyase [Pseudoalteromonas sp. S1610]
MQTIIAANETSSISTHDRGLNYGDGFFTTAIITDGQVEHWAYHKARLIECAQRLAFPALEFTALESHITQQVASQAQAVVKIVVTRGEGGRGYAPPSECNLNIFVSVLPYPKHYNSLTDTGISLSISPIKLAVQPHLAGLKTLNRLEQVLIKNALQAQHTDDALVLDCNNNVIETSAANIFAIKNNKVFSPRLDECGIKGVFLQSLCDKLAVEFKTVSVDDLTQADAVFLCNSLMKIVPVKSLDEHYFDIVHSQSLLNELLAKEA